MVAASRLFHAVARAFPYLPVFLQDSGERFRHGSARLGHRDGAAEFRSPSGFFADPLHQAVRQRGLVELVRGTTALRVVEASHAFLEPMKPGIAHGADVELLHLGHIVTEQRLIQQQGRFAYMARIRASTV